MSHTATDSTILLGHGSGGQMMKRIIDEVFLDAFGSPELLEGNDAGVAALPGSGRIAMSTDSFVVTPQFFPGGNIGRLAVCGTVNDVATSGANVRYLSCGFILEEGYPMDKLRQIVQTMAETAREAGVKIITGDTKVVERGGADGVYINTAGVGEVPAGVALSGANCQPGDVIRRRAPQPPDCRRAGRRPRHTLLPRSHARRPGVHAQRVCAGQRRCHGNR